MADAAVTFLLENLSHLLVSSADLVSGAEDEIQLLKNEVELLRAVLLREEIEKRPLGEMERRRIEDLVCHCQDTIDSHLVESAAAQSKIDLFRRRRRSAYAKPAGSLAEEVRSLRPLLEEVRVDFADLQLIGSETILEEPHRIKVNQVPSIHQDTVVGFKYDQDKVFSLLRLRPKYINIVSIIGMPGLGKTTMAKKIYQSSQIKMSFPVRIWVYVSQHFNLKDVFLTILKEVTSKDMSSMSEQELAPVVRGFLDRRKFLLVLDDVWECDHIIAIRDALPGGNKMNSKVLVTTRSERIAVLSNYVHRLRFLTGEESRELLRLEVFGRLNSTCPIELVTIWQSIVDACKGLPLVIVVMGGILLHQLSETQSLSSLKTEWMELSESLGASGYADAIQKCVALSYSRLPNDLRNLFLYLGVFPEDFKIPATILTRLWIAEGFIQHKEGQSLEDIAEENLNRLIRRKLVIVDEMRSNGKVKACRLHDIIRDFCIMKGSAVNLFQEITSSEEGTFHPPISDVQRYRRLCIHSNPLGFFSSEPYLPDARSFSCFCKTETILLPEETSKIPGDSFKLLRVLDIKPIRFTRFPLQLTQLFCLRFIVLSGEFRILPAILSTLRNIQTLTIHTTSRILEIKADIWKMNGLRHLKTNASIVLHHEPDDHSDQELQTLSNLSPENCTNNVFDRTRCLKKLGIRGILSKLFSSETGSRNFDNLVVLNNLENLKLLNDVHMVSPSEGRLPSLPPQNKFPPKLRSLTLSATFLSWEHMSVLGTLEKLEVLKLKDNAFVGECWEVEDGSFPRLQVLQIGYTNLVYWKVASGHFPKLRSLAVRNCENLNGLPLGIDSVEDLREIELLCPSKGVVLSAQRIARNVGIKLSIYFYQEEWRLN